MGHIQVLSFEIANLIAAGEVVERPSSVLKELIENAIDAGSTHIVAEIKRGGVALIRVSDNGCGISREDLPVALKRHATSKIQSRDDLGNITTLGFRGEALAAIASVSRLTMITKTRDAVTASMLTSEGGVVTDVTDVGASDGTTVVVEDLFFNVPARRKFLKKDATEAMNVAVLVDKVALSRPDIAIQLLIDGEERFHTPGDGSVENTVYAILGREYASKMLAVDGTVNHIHVHGFIGRSDNVRRNRNLENVFINGRYVKSMTVTAAVEKAFTSYIAPECFPTCVLFVDMHPSVVDVNVHPAKLEVKFSDERTVFEAVYYTVRRTLEDSAYRPDMTLGKSYQRSFAPSTSAGQLRMSTDAAPNAASAGARPPLTTPPSHTSPVRPMQQRSTPVPPPRADAMTAFEKRVYAPKDELRVSSGAGGFAVSASTTATLTPTDSLTLLQTFDKPAVSPAPSPVTDSTPAYRYVGEAFDCYVMVEYEGDLLIIDKHAAHERVLFEDLKRQKEADTRVASQQLLLPMQLPMTAEVIETLRAHVDEFCEIGFSLEVTADGVTISAIPSLLELSAAQDLLCEMADELHEGRGNPTLTDAMRRERMLYQTACKGAIKGGRFYDRPIIDWLIGRVLALPDITVCPHGRPIAYTLKKRELDRQFDRIK